VQTPGLASPDMQYGDVGKLRAAMQAAPLPGAGATARPSAPGAGGVTPTSRSGGLPDFLYNQDSARPNEPVTAGLSSGAGPGPEILPSPSPDVRIQTLQYIWQTYGNRDALAMVQKISADTAAAQQQSFAPVPGQPEQGPPV